MVAAVVGGLMRVVSGTLVRPVAAQGTELVVTLQGEDESAAARAIEDLFEGKFGETA